MYDDKDICIYHIGSFIFDNVILEEELNRLSMSNIGELKVLVYSNEGPIRHFHLKSSSSNWETCIELLKPKYFHHGKNNKILNSKQCRELDDFMRSPCSFNENQTNWEMALSLWNIGNRKYISKVSDYEQPDYIKLS